MRTNRGAASVLLAAVVVFGATGCDLLGAAPAPLPTATPRPTPQPQRATVQVRRGTIIDAIKVLGRVVAAEEVDLSFRNSGRIREVYVQPGDLVAPGQVIAELDQRNLPWDLAKAQNAVAQAEVRLAAAESKQVVDDSVVDEIGLRANQINVAQAQLALEKALAGPLDPDVKKAEADLASAQAALDRARFDLRDKQAQLAARQADLAARLQGPDPLQVMQAQADVETARIRLEQVKAGPRPEDVRAAQIALDQERTKLDKLRDQPKAKPEDVDNARIEVERAQNALAKVLADIDAGTIRGEANRDAAVRTAQLQLEQAQNNYQRLASAAATAAELVLQEQAVRLAELALAKVQNANPDIESAQIALSLALTKLETLTAGPTEQELTTLRTQIQSLEYAVENAQNAVSVAEAQLATVQARHTLLLRGASEFDVQDLRNRVAREQSVLAAAQARLQAKRQTIAQNRIAAAFDLDVLRRAVTQAQFDVQNFQGQMGDVKVIAPFAGKITRLAARPGDTVQAFFPIVNVSGLQGLVIKADISEADLERLAVGMPVELTMDAYPNQVLRGRIDSLPAQTVGQVGQAPERSTRIVVDWPGPGAEMGMLARVQITLQVKEDVLIVPNGAVRTVGRRRFVEYMDGEIKRSRNVELGIVTDQETEIVSGLQEGMVILAGQS